jgi:hypothetical protein
MFNKYIDILSDCSKNILKQMGNIDISDVTVKQEKSLSTTYSIAHSIHYEDSKNKLKGDFILGFADESEAIPIAAAIAENIGLAPIGELPGRPLKYKFSFYLIYDSIFLCHVMLELMLPVPSIILS